MLIELRRVYEYKNYVGFRILVDGLWPRGIKKKKIDLWMKEVASSKELREWYSHDLSKCMKFKERYKEELKNKTELVNKILDLSGENNVIPLYSASSKCGNRYVGRICKLIAALMT